jgi:hypothetical protein
MYSGAIISNNNTGEKEGGGIYIKAPETPSDSSFDFIMNGGTITGNENEWAGGGIMLYKGRFIMNAGTISGNTSGAGGGVCVDGNGEFTMMGGEISGNKANDFGGGGVYVGARGTFTMEGGYIKGNKANLTADYDNININGNGGGVYMYVDGIFTMKGGEIEGNKAINGGGVYVGGGTFTMEGGEIKGNKANRSDNDNDNTNGNGGGVYVGSVYMYVSGTDYEYVGGGTFTMNGGGTFTMNGGGIKRNEATGGFGGGVYVQNNSQVQTIFTKAKGDAGLGIAGGVIYGSQNADANTASSGQAVYVASDTPKKRDSTADENVDLDSSTPGTSGGWDE